MRKFGRALIVLGVLAVLLIGAEFGIRGLVQSQAQQAVVSAGIKVDDPTLDLAGGSVLAALVRGRFVDVFGGAATAQVQFEQHQVDLHDVRYRGSEIKLVTLSEVVVGRLDVTGKLDWNGLSEVAGLSIRYGGEGRVLVTYRVDVAGLSLLDVGISGVPRLDVAAHQMELTDARIDVAGVELNARLSQQIMERTVKPIPLTVADRVQVTAVSVVPDGLVVDLTATEVPVRR
ncbi:MAG: LmeA family phospholipid-binding protein [Micropruina sp.]|uniref:LmeA family phospholipid-binding protein n=1 Tax=Micropruina sp. TaxID=2737536 RepID=UPI0039E29103